MSGGERKRTNLGIELTADPEVLFLDEPTSGLDSFQAEAVVRVLSRLCKEGRTIFMSIHQPSSQVYALFDKLMLLSEGQCVYFGEASSAVSYFANLGHKCPSDFNPADFLLETISIDTRSGIQMFRKRRGPSILSIERQGALTFSGRDCSRATDIYTHTHIYNIYIYTYIYIHTYV